MVDAPAFDPSQPFETIGAPAFDPSKPFEDATKPAASGMFANTPDDTWLTGAAKGSGTAAIKGLSNSAGIIGNLGNFADYVLARGHSAITGRPVQDILGEYAKAKEAPSLSRMIDPSRILPSGEDISAPILKQTGEYRPQSEIGRMGQSGLEAAFGMVGPGAGAVSKGTSATQALLRTPAKFAPVNAIAGAAGQGVVDATGDPLLGMAAGLATPAVGSAIGAGARHVAKPFLEDIPGIGGRYAGTRDAEVGKRLAAAAENPDALDRALNPGPLRPGEEPNSNLIPGSKPTLGQMSGDMGILQAERQARTSDNTAFNVRDAEQNSARISGLRDMAPEADTMRPSQLFQQQLETIERGGEDAVQRIQAGAQRLAGQLGPGESPEASGAALRATLEAAKKEANLARRKLYDAVDPDGSVTVIASPVRERAQELAKGVDEFDTPLSPVEARIFGQIGSLPDVVPFKSLVALDKNIYAAMSAERRAAGETPVWGRLSQLKKSAMDAINNAVDNQYAYEKAAVSAGKLAPANTIDARLEQVANEYGGHIGGSLGDAQAIAGGNAGASPAGSFGFHGAEGEGAGRLGNAPGGSGVQARSLPSNAPDLNNYPIFYPGGELRARYEIADLPSLVTSHTADFTANPKFPQELQPRARESAPARDQVNGMAARIQPERLGPSPEANSGAPIVGPDNVVESGNGRTLAIAKAYQKGNPAYRDWLESQGFDTSGMKRPVLIARRTSEMTPAQREYFANSANSAAGLKMSATEQAASDAKLLNAGTLESIADAPIRSPENRDFVRSFADKLPANERGGILDKDGNLSQTGVRRIEGALAARAYDDPAFIGRAFDSADSNIRNLAGALVDAAGPWAKMREAARSGAIDGSHDITHELMDVVHKVMRARDEGRPIRDMLHQNDMFGSDAAPLIESLLFRNAENGVLASRQRVASGLKSYAVEAEKNLAGPRLFGDTINSGDILKNAISKAEPESLLPPSRDATEQVLADVGPAEIPSPRPSTKELIKARFEATKPKAPTLEPNFDQSAADRLRAAKDSHIAYAETYRNPVIKRALSTQGGSDNYTTPTSALPSRAVVRGPQGYQTAQAYLKAAKQNPDAIASMQDAALSPLRNSLKPDGTINPAKFDAWKRDYAGALRALDEVSPGFSKKFDSAARASDILVEAGAVTKQKLADFQKSVAGKFLDQTKPSEVENKVGLMLTNRAKGPTEMRDLVKRVGSDQDALDGLRKAGIDWIVRKFSTTAEGGTSGEKLLSSAAFRNFVRDNQNTLAALYPAEQVGMFRRIADDLQQANRSVTAAAIKGSPGTAKDVLPFINKSMEQAKKHTSFLSAAMAGSFIGFETAGLKGAAVGAATAGSAYLLGSLRAAGIRKADDMFRDALLNPERARYYLAKASEAKENIGPSFALARSLRRELITQPVINESVADRKRRSRPAA